MLPPRKSSIPKIDVKDPATWLRRARRIRMSWVRRRRYARRVDGPCSLVLEETATRATHRSGALPDRHEKERGPVVRASPNGAYAPSPSRRLGQQLGGGSWKSGNGFRSPRNV